MVEIYLGKMIPGMNPRQMQQAMKKLGIKQKEIDAEAVIIRTKTEDIILRKPSVSKVNMMGQWTYQITGEEEVRPLDTTPELSEEDIKTVMEQAKCSKEEAKKALEESDGNLAEAILLLQKQ